ncbi:MAG: hypothetical protein K6F35_08995 [Lachnospiraceae bacterium]|nr:hypothetical protein [Lachnospiraceae bacterium]
MKDLLPEKVIKFALLYFDDIEKNIYPCFQKYDNERILVQVTAYGLKEGKYNSIIGGQIVPDDLFEEK